MNMDYLDEVIIGWSEMGLIIFPSSLKVVIFFALLPKQMEKSFDRVIPFATATTSVNPTTSQYKHILCKLCREKGQPQNACFPKCHARLETLFKGSTGSVCNLEG